MKITSTLTDDEMKATMDEWVNSNERNRGACCTAIANAAAKREREDIIDIFKTMNASGNFDETLEILESIFFKGERRNITRSL